MHRVNLNIRRNLTAYTALLLVIVAGVALSGSLGGSARASAPPPVPTGGPVRLHADHWSVHVGQKAFVTIENHSSQIMEWGGCLALQRWTGRSWSGPEDAGCLASVMIRPHGFERLDALQTYAGLSPGAYRVALGYSQSPRLPITGNAATRYAFVALTVLR